MIAIIIMMMVMMMIIKTYIAQFSMTYVIKYALQLDEMIKRSWIQLPYKPEFFSGFNFTTP